MARENTENEEREKNKCYFYVVIFIFNHINTRHSEIFFIIRKTIYRQTEVNKFRLKVHCLGDVKKNLVEIFHDVTSSYVSVNSSRVNLRQSIAGISFEMDVLSGLTYIRLSRHALHFLPRGYNYFCSHAITP